MKSIAFVVTAGLVTLASAAQAGTAPAVETAGRDRAVTAASLSQVAAGSKRQYESFGSSAHVAAVQGRQGYRFPAGPASGPNIAQSRDVEKVQGRS